MSRMMKFALLFLLLFSLQTLADSTVYGPVVSGETVSRIAGKLVQGFALSRATRKQLMVALWIRNPDGFNDPCNINTLKRDQMLLVPAVEDVLSIPAEEAQALIVEQYRLQNDGLTETDTCSRMPRPLWLQRSTTVATATRNPFPDLEWMKLPAEVTDHWHLEEHPDNANWLSIRPAIKIAPTEKEVRILVVISKRSGSYKLALARILSVFRQHKFSALLTVLNINREEHLIRQVVAYAEQQQMDLIFSIGSESASLLHEHYRYGSIPVVTSTNKDPVLLGQIDSYNGGADTNIAFTSLNVPLSIQMSYLKLLRPGLKVIALMYNRNHKQVMATEVRPTREQLESSGIKVVDIAVESRETAQETLVARIPFAIEEMQAIDPSLQNAIFWMTSSTAIFANTETINRFTGEIPVVASIPNAVTAGENSAVLAIGIDRRSNAHMATLYAMQILQQGRHPGSFEVGIVTPPDISINFLVARKIGLKIPFEFFENATFIYDYSGDLVRNFGKKVQH